jgi:hypothetical protein
MLGFFVFASFGNKRRNLSLVMIVSYINIKQNRPERIGSDFVSMSHLVVLDQTCH